MRWVQKLIAANMMAQFHGFVFSRVDSYKLRVWS